MESVFETVYPHYELILVDNASRDGSLELAQQRFGNCKSLKIVKNLRNVGFAEGNNIGIKHVSPNSKYVVFLNIDTRVDRKWLTELVDAMESDESIGTAQCKLLLLDNPIYIECAGGMIDHYCRVLELGKFEKDLQRFDKIREIFYAKGAAIVIRRELFEEVGRFDPDFFLYGEEVDLAWRVWLRGYRVVLVPSARVYHKGGGVTELHSDLVTYMTTKSWFLTIGKNYGLANLSRAILLFQPKKISYLLYQSIRLQNPSHLIAYFKALIWLTRNLKRIYVKRTLVQNRLRCVSDSHVRSKMLTPKAYQREIERIMFHKSVASMDR